MGSNIEDESVPDDEEANSLGGNKTKSLVDDSEIKFVGTETKSVAGNKKDNFVARHLEFAPAVEEKFDDKFKDTGDDSAPDDDECEDNDADIGHGREC